MVITGAAGRRLPGHVRRLMTEQKHALGACRFGRRENGLHRRRGRLDRCSPLARLDGEEARRINPNCAQSSQGTGLMVVGVKRDRHARQTLQQRTSAGMNRAGRATAGFFFIDDGPKPGRKPGTRLGIACGKFRAGRFDGGEQALVIDAHAFASKDGIQIAAQARSVQVQIHQDAVQAHNGNPSRPGHCPGQSSQWGDMRMSLLQFHNNQT